MENLPPARTRLSDPLSDLPRDDFRLLVQVREALGSLPASLADRPEFARITQAIAAGPAGARRAIVTGGGAVIASALMQASLAFRATGQFRQCDLLQRLAFMVAGWERRLAPRPS